MSTAAAVEPKIFAKIFFDGVSSVSSGSGRQYLDGLEYLEKIFGPDSDIVREYRVLIEDDDAAEDEDEAETKASPTSPPQRLCGNL
jgi:hypothetical protein